MKITFTLLITVICAVGAYAQNPTQVSGSINIDRPVTFLSATARFQLVQIASFGFNTVRLDRYTGKTYIYDYGRRRWFPLDVRGGLPASLSNTSPKYEIYAESENFNFLINTETGQTWVLAQRTWEPILD